MGDVCEKSIAGYRGQSTVGEDREVCGSYFKYRIVTSFVEKLILLALVLHLQVCFSSVQLLSCIQLFVTL